MLWRVFPAKEGVRSRRDDIVCSSAAAKMCAARTTESTEVTELGCPEPSVRVSSVPSVSSVVKLMCAARTTESTEVTELGCREPSVRVSSVPSVSSVSSVVNLMCAARATESTEERFRPLGVWTKNALGSTRQVVPKDRRINHG